MTYLTYFDGSSFRWYTYRGIKISMVESCRYLCPVIYNIDMFTTYTGDVSKINIREKKDFKYYSVFSDGEISYIYNTEIFLFTDQFRINYK